MLKLIAGTHAAVWASIGGIAILAGCKRPDTEVGLEYAQDDLLTRFTKRIPLQWNSPRCERIA